MSDSDAPDSRANDVLLEPFGEDVDRAAVPEDDDGEDHNLVARLADVGSVAQASVPGLYAWAVTVAPVAWARGAGPTAKAAAIAGVVALAVAIGFERSDQARRARLVSVWGLVGASALVWLIAPALNGVTRIDAARGISGMLGWGLFAYASSAPTYRRSSARPRFEGRELAARAPSPRGDRYYLAAAALAAAALQVVGWTTAEGERALLVRLVTVGAGIALISQAAQLALARHKRPRAVPTKARRRAVVTALAAVSGVAVLGIVLALLR